MEGPDMCTLKLLCLLYQINLRTCIWKFETTGQASGAMSWAFIESLKRDGPNQPFTVLLKNMRRHMTGKYTQVCYVEHLFTSIHIYILRYWYRLLYIERGAESALHCPTQNHGDTWPANTRRYVRFKECIYSITKMALCIHMCVCLLLKNVRRHLMYPPNDWPLNNVSLSFCWCICDVSVGAADLHVAQDGPPRPLHDLDTRPSSLQTWHWLIKALGSRQERASRSTTRDRVTDVLFYTHTGRKGEGARLDVTRPPTERAGMCLRGAFYMCLWM